MSGMTGYSNPKSVVGISMAETLGVVGAPRGGTPHDPFRTAV